MDTAVMILQFVVSIALIVIILMQKSKGEGLGSIGGGAQMFFDQAKGVDRVLEKSTTWLAVVFMVLSIIISIFYI